MVESSTPEGDRAIYVLQPFADAAALLRSNGCDALHGSSADTLISSLGWTVEHLDDRRRAELSSAFQLAGRFERVFSLSLPTAYNVALVGATVDPRQFGIDAPIRDVSGKAFDPGEAFLGCVGEGAEYLSLQTWGDEDVRRVPIGEIDPRLVRHRGDASVECLIGRRFGNGTPGWVPADLCLRVAGSAPATAETRSGYGAGASPAAAALSAVLELVERDAVALWWLGGRAPRAVPLETTFADPHGPALADVLSRRERRSWILDITTETAIPTMLAWSTDRSGNDFALGAAARSTPHAAVAGALLELTQLEFALQLAKTRRNEVGDAGLNDVERRHLRRSRLAAEQCEAFRPSGLSTLADARLSEEDIRSRVAGCWLVDLTRASIGIPCVRAVAPDLQTYPATSVSERLRRCAEQNGPIPPDRIAMELM